jgi:hypothetical protein
MSPDEIESWQKKLIEAKAIKDKGQRNIALIEIIESVGASGCGGDKPWAERDAQNIASIQQALQTATSINMAKTASRNMWAAIIATVIALISALAAWCAVLSR